MLRNVEIRKGYRFYQGGMEAGSSIFPAEESQKKLDSRHLRAVCRRFGLVISCRLITW